ncbi:hypothetical protein AB0L65_62520 [Nonomuraea sp. NPDC052116]|uniref:hypothetical protein n=1 Tax=Nonomuraea sp. NPDC052116 TaxID=3155665 RepID=UPI0034327C3C
MSPIGTKSWFDHLSLPQQVVTIIMSLIGLLGGVTLLLADPPPGPVFILILAFVLFSMAILRSIPRVRAWVGFQLFLAHFWCSSLCPVSSNPPFSR